MAQQGRVQQTVHSLHHMSFIQLFALAAAEMHRLTVFASRSMAQQGRVQQCLGSPNYVDSFHWVQQAC